jgi:hypothetical protein
VSDLAAPPQDTPGLSRRDLAIYASLALVTGLVCYAGGHRISRQDSHFWRMILAGIGIALVVLRPMIGKLVEAARDQAVRVFQGAMVVICTLGWFNYYQFDSRVFAGINDYVDITYYYLNSKYLDQLGFYGFYAAMIVADQETGDLHTHALTKYRDLRDDTVKPIAVAIEHGKELEATKFTPEQWKVFQEDTEFFLAKMSTDTMKSNFYVDHGYNPPPTWSIVGGTMADVVPKEYLKEIASVDDVLVVAMFGAIAWGFGLETMLWSMLFFVCTFSGRWPILGQALMRFDWLAALLGGMACLRRHKWATAGGLLAYAALNRVFPAIFLGAWLWTAIGDTWRERRLLPKHLRFAAGALAVAVVLTAGAFARYGLSTFEESASNLEMHNRSFSSHRVGLGGLLVYRGETTRDEINAHGGMGEREKQVQALIPTLHVLGALAIAFVAATAIRTRREAWETLPWLILPLFILTNPQVNYYNLRLVAIVWHAVHLALPRDRGPPADAVFHRIGLGLLFAVEVLAQWCQVNGWDRHAVNMMTSAGLALYLAVLSGWLGLDLARGRVVQAV